MLELTFPGLALRQSYTPADQEHLNTSDTDLGSSAPALLGDNRVVLAGKDGIMRVLALSRLDGHPPSGRHTALGGEVQRLPIPGGGELFSAPAVWRRRGRTTVFVAGFNGTGAYALRSGRLARAVGRTAIPAPARSSPAGCCTCTTPKQAGSTSTTPAPPGPSSSSPAAPGHWNSPIVVDGHVVEPEGDANAHSLTGTLDLFSVG